jgi:hypothetical protein
MEEHVRSDSYSFEDLREHADDVSEGICKGITVLLLSAALPGLQSGDDQLLLLRRQALKFPYAVITTLFKFPASAVCGAIRKREKANNDL